MSILCQSVSICRQSDVNPMPAKCRPSANSLPIRYKFSANPVPRLPISHQSIANPIPIYQFNANLPSQCQSITDQFQSANPKPTQKLSINSLPIHCQSSTNLTNPLPIDQAYVNPRTICQLFTNPSINCQSKTDSESNTNQMPMLGESVDPLPISQSNANLIILDQSNPWQICQSITNPSIQRQFCTNLPTHHQSAHLSAPMIKTGFSTIGRTLARIDRDHANPAGGQSRSGTGN